ncbi:MAG: hypothetical protein EA401_01090 [Planctomycetota bacterium]|nr:MAG: hypothetical protein EA401_01090 [Planctomycetota bacterium]
MPWYLRKTADMGYLVSTPFRTMLIAGVAVCVLLGVAFLIWWHYALPISLHRAHAELRQQGIDSRWEDVQERELSSLEDREWADRIYNAINTVTATDEAHFLLTWHPEMDVDIDVARKHYAQLDHEVIAFIDEELRQWHHRGLAPLLRRTTSDYETSLYGEYGEVPRREWARLCVQRARLSLNKSERAKALLSATHLLSLREEPSVRRLLVDNSIASEVINYFIQSSELWDDYGEKLLASFEDWCHLEEWQPYFASAILYDLRTKTEALAQYQFSDISFTEAIQIRLGAGSYLHNSADLLMAFSSQYETKRFLLLAMQNFYFRPNGHAGWWRQWHAMLRDQWFASSERALRIWVTIGLKCEVLRHQMDHGPWPEDPWATPGQGLRRYPEEGPLERVWSVGPDGIDDGGDRDSDDIDLRWPAASWLSY